MSGIEEPSAAFLTVHTEEQAEERASSNSTLASKGPGNSPNPSDPGNIDEEEDFDWFGGRGDRILEQSQSQTTTAPESEAIWASLMAMVPKPIRDAFFVVIGVLLLIPTLLGFAGVPMPKYLKVYLHVYTLTGLTLLYLPGLIIKLVQKTARKLRRSLLWSKTELPSYIDAVSVPLTVSVCASILYTLWALELPPCKPDRICLFRYVHRLYYVGLGSCVGFSVEIALMRQ